MNDKCKYCDYVSECSRKCEYDSILCKVQRNFPKVVDKSYEQLQQENQQLKIQISAREEEYKRLEDNWNIIKQEMLKIRQSTFSKYNSNEWENCLSFNDDIEPILDKMKELQGSSSDE